MVETYELSMVTRQDGVWANEQRILCDRQTAALMCRMMAQELDPTAVTREPPEHAACRLRAEDEPPYIPLRRP